VPESDADENAERVEQSAGSTQPAQEGNVGRGTIRWQDASTSRPRQPTVAESRQRDKARKARELAARFAEEQERQSELRAAQRRKVLMGSVAVVGLVGAVALGYSLLNDDDEVSATCVRDGTNEVVADNYCSTGNAGSGGIFIYAGTPYRYYYGGSNTGVGSTARGGTIELPKGTTGRTSAGTSISRGGGSDGSSISRGGFGSSSHGSSGS
jgi:type II secretory pathway pseudopilin PulG